MLLPQLTQAPRSGRPCWIIGLNHSRPRHDRTRHHHIGHGRLTPPQEPLDSTVDPSKRCNNTSGWFVSTSAADQLAPFTGLGQMRSCRPLPTPTATTGSCKSPLAELLADRERGVAAARYHAVCA